ncbi:MAG: signal transduction protein [Desulfobulbus propionicus]|nr:MAG: signal transduction protein [Desulfobulbus propionicus]PIE65803.1 MAG: signal transduction protein [Desulfobacterales bacterium]
MEQYIARQPIFNVHRKVHGYELLYRGAKNSAMDQVSGSRATTSVLTSTFLTRDINDISSYKPCFVNFTQDLLEKRLPESFSKESIVVEVLENVEPSRKVIQACQRLRDKGYTIALDDFIYDKQSVPLLELANIVKIDFRLTPIRMIERTLRLLERYKVKLLAEKVETSAEFEEAAKRGFVYFQGYFFSKPEQITIQELTTTQITQLRLLAEVAKKNTTVEALHKIISNDISVSYKLLRFLNSSYFYRLQEISSIKHAIAFLGEKELRHFVMLVIISEMASEKPGELIRLGLVRAKFCELLGEQSTSKKIDASELFMLGLFSLLDAMLDLKMAEIMKKLPVSQLVKEALIAGSGPYAPYLSIVKYYERNQQDKLASFFAQKGITPEQVNEYYLTAIRYASGLM